MGLRITFYIFRGEPGSLKYPELGDFTIQDLTIGNITFLFNPMIIIKNYPVKLFVEKLDTTSLKPINQYSMKKKQFLSAE